MPVKTESVLIQYKGVVRVNLSEINRLLALKLQRGEDIYHAIIDDTPSFRFGDALKCFLRSRGSTKDLATSDPSDLKTYSAIICAEFSARQVPAHFDLADGSLRKLSMNWLSAKSITRENVILLGFGLGMTLNEVERFLTEALLEHGLNPKDPFETVAWYCFKNGLDYHAFDDLRVEFVVKGRSSKPDVSFVNTLTGKLRQERESIDSKASLFVYLNRISVVRNEHTQSVTGRKYFMELYRSALHTIDPSADDDFSNASRLERTLYLTTPLSKERNLVSFKQTQLGEKLHCSRLTRQRIGQIIRGEIAVKRDYLVTLSFLCDALDLEHHSTTRFVKTTDAMLVDCGMCALNACHPYDKLLTLCACTDDPLLSFADVFELCHREETEGGNV